MKYHEAWQELREMLESDTHNKDEHLWVNVMAGHYLAKMNDLESKHE